MTEALIRVTISTLLAFLASTVKNPDSKKARALRARVQDVRDACDEFLEAVQ